MEGCLGQNLKLIGKNCILDMAYGCPETMPDEEEFKPLGAMTTKNFSLSPNTITSEADDTGGFVATFVTGSDMSLGGDVEVDEKDKDIYFGVSNAMIYFANEVQSGRQPSLWVRFHYAEVLIAGYFNITTLEGSADTNSFATATVEFKPAVSSTISFTKQDTVVPVTGVTITPTSGSVTVGATTTFMVNVAPANATNKAFTVVSAAPTKATVATTGTTATVTGVAAGASNITATTTDGSFTAVYAATVTA